MNIEEIKQLIDLANASGIAELEVERGGNRVRIRRIVVPGTQEFILHAAHPHHPPGNTAPAPAAITPMVDEQVNPTAVTADPNLTLVKAPIVGTFYASPSPGSPPFVKPGDTVQAGQVLCIIESMKLMNEIEAEQAGVVVAILVENGRPVEYGEALFSIRPV
jgi:acetyl-CoA carboxylase biotin carboxyl carrier protein